MLSGFGCFAFSSLYFFLVSDSITICPVFSSQFADIVHFTHPQFTQLSTITFGGSIISDGSDADGNQVSALSHTTFLWANERFACAFSRHRGSLGWWGQAKTFSFPQLQKVMSS